MVSQERRVTQTECDITFARNKPAEAEDVLSNADYSRIKPL